MNQIRVIDPANDRTEEDNEIFGSKGIITQIEEMDVWNVERFGYMQEYLATLNL